MAAQKGRPLTSDERVVRASREEGPFDHGLSYAPQRAAVGRVRTPAPESRAEEPLGQRAEPVEQGLEQVAEGPWAEGAVAVIKRPEEPAERPEAVSEGPEAVAAAEEGAEPGAADHALDVAGGPPRVLRPGLQRGGPREGPVPLAARPDRPLRGPPAPARRWVSSTSRAALERAAEVRSRGPPRPLRGVECPEIVRPAGYGEGVGPAGPPSSWLRARASPRAPVSGVPGAPSGGPPERTAGEGREGPPTSDAKATKRGGGGH